MGIYLKQIRVEVVSPSGVCCAGMHAFKYAYLATKAGEVQQSVATGSERFSLSLLPEILKMKQKD